MAGGWHKHFETSNVWKIDEWTQKLSKEFWCKYSRWHRAESGLKQRVCAVLLIYPKSIHSGISRTRKQGNFSARNDSNSGLVSWKFSHQNWLNLRRSRIGYSKFCLTSLWKRITCNWIKVVFHSKQVLFSVDSQVISSFSGDFSDFQLRSGKEKREL